MWSTVFLKASQVCPSSMLLTYLQVHWRWLFLQADPHLDYCQWKLLA